MEKFILKEKLTPKFQLIIPNKTHSGIKDVCEAINSFIKNTTKQEGTFIRSILAAIKVENPAGWHITTKENVEYMTITLEKIELTIVPCEGENI